MSIETLLEPVKRLWKKQTDDSNLYFIPFEERQTKKHTLSHLRDFILSMLVIVLATLFGFLFSQLGYSEANIITVYIFGVLVISVLTIHPAYSFVFSIISVMVFNFFFTNPKFTLLAYDNGDLITFSVMFLSAFMTGTLAAKMKRHAYLSAQTAYRTALLFDTNQKLSLAKSKQELVESTAKQFNKLLNRDVVIYLTKDGQLEEPQVFPINRLDERLLDAKEKQAALQVMRRKEPLETARCFYLSIHINETIFGVVGIANNQRPLEPFESSMVTSILGECALALENEKNAKEKEAAAIMAKNEQLRANLLRSISHDLRTPLTSISGNASNLLTHASDFDEETKKRLYTDIYDDSMWLINLVENLLAVTRIEEGKMNLHLSTELMDEVISEALLHICKQSAEHHIEVEIADELLLAKMDARLIVQVVINLVDNAIKHTPKDSEILVKAYSQNHRVIVSVEDDGPGIDDAFKEKVFEMFYCGAHPIADSRRSLGLGLSLCRSIIQAHGGEITVTDHQPRGAVFTFWLPQEEVRLHE